MRKGQAGRLSKYLPEYSERFPSLKRFPLNSLPFSHVLLFRFFCTSHGRVRLPRQISPRVSLESSWFRSSRCLSAISATYFHLSTMTDSWSAICRQCVGTVAGVPTSVLLGSVLATAIGVFALVSCYSPLRSTSYPRTRSWLDCLHPRWNNYTNYSLLRILVLRFPHVCRAGPANPSTGRKEV